MLSKKNPLQSLYFFAQGVSLQFCSTFINQNLLSSTLFCVSIWVAYELKCVTKPHLTSGVAAQFNTPSAHINPQVPDSNSRIHRQGKECSTWERNRSFLIINSEKNTHLMCSRRERSAPEKPGSLSQLLKQTWNRNHRLCFRFYCKQPPFVHSLRKQTKMLLITMKTEMKLYRTMSKHR